MIVFYLMLVVATGSGSKRQELTHYMYAVECEQMRDTFNSVRLASGRFECWLGVYGETIRFPPKGK